MAEKTASLSIVIRTVDQATAKLNHIAEHLEKMQKPYRDLGKAFGKVVEATGIDRVKEGFAGVGEAVKSVGEHLLHIAEIAGLGTAEVVHLIHEFAELGNVAKVIGISADALAGLRYAAAQAGVSAEELDGGMEKFNKTLGQLHQRTGPLYELLLKVSPALLRQVAAAKTSKEALDVMADAMARLQDPTKKALLATAAFGKGGQPFINFLSQGSKALEAAVGEHEQLAGSQEGAVESAEKMHKAMLRLGAVFDGLKAALLEGLEPAFMKISAALQNFLVAHKAEIAAFIEDFGEKLPGRIDALVSAFRDAFSVIQPVWDAIGGMKGAAIALAAVITGKLIFALVELGIALATNPIGLVAVGFGLLVAAGLAVVANWDYVKGFFVECWNVIKDAFGSAWDFIKNIVDKVIGAVDTVKDALASLSGAIDFSDKNAATGGIFGDAQRKFFGVDAPAPPPAGVVTTKNETTIKVDFANAPKGTRVSTDARGPQQVDLSVGYQMAIP